MKGLMAFVIVCVAIAISASLHYKKYSGVSSDIDTLSQELQGLPKRTAITVRLYSEVEYGEVDKAQIRYLLAPRPVYLSNNKHNNPILYVSGKSSSFADINNCGVIWQHVGYKHNYHLVNCPQ